MLIGSWSMHNFGCEGAFIAGPRARGPVQAQEHAAQRGKRAVQPFARPEIARTAHGTSRILNAVQRRPMDCL
jgi:hypothetical protein